MFCWHRYEILKAFGGSMPCDRLAIKLLKCIKCNKIKIYFVDTEEYTSTSYVNECIEWLDNYNKQGKRK